MDRFESFLASKVKVMGDSSGISAADFLPLSSGMPRSSSSSCDHLKTPAVNPVNSAAGVDLGQKSVQPSWRSLFGGRSISIYSIL